MKRAVILFAEGYETVEALLVVDLLRRGGVEVTMASITEDEFVRSSHGVNVEMDAVLGEVDVLDYDAIILPGGMPGTINLGESDAVRKAILAMNDAGKIVIDGVDITKLSEHKRAAFLGRVFQDPMTGTAATMSIEENMAIAARRGQRRGLGWGITKKERESFKESLKTLDLGLEDRSESQRQGRWKPRCR